MREVVKKNKIVYDYVTHKISDNTKLSIILYIVAILFLVLSVFISYIYLGDGPSVIAGIGISSIIFNIASMVVVVYDIYIHDNYQREIGIMLILQLLLFSIWIFIIS